MFLICTVSHRCLTLCWCLIFYLVSASCWCAILIQQFCLSVYLVRQSRSGIGLTHRRNFFTGASWLFWLLRLINTLTYLLTWYDSRVHMLMFRNKSMIGTYCVKYIKSIAIVDLLLRWEIWHESCCKYTAESNSEGTFKIGQHFSKLWTNIDWHIFMAHGVSLHLLNTTIVNCGQYKKAIGRRQTLFAFVVYYSVWHTSAVLPYEGSYV